MQSIRDLARILIYPNHSSKKGRPVLIYGAGAAGNELYHAIKNNKNIDIVGFFDNSNSLRGSEINNIQIYGKNKDIKKLKERYNNLEIYLAIPSLNINDRRKIISSLEKFKVSVRVFHHYMKLLQIRKK